MLLEASGSHRAGGGEAPPSAEEGEAVVERADIEVRKTGRRRAEPRNSSRQSAHRSARRPIDDTPEPQQRLAPRLPSMEDVGEAAILLSRAWSSRINAEMGQQSHAKILDMLLVLVLQMANGALALRKAMSHSGDLLWRSQGRVNKYKEQCQGLAEKLDRQQEETKAWEEDLGGRLREAESRAEIEDGQASAAETKLALVSARLESSRRRIEELISQLQHVESLADAAADETCAAMNRAATMGMAAVQAEQGQA